MLWRVLLLLDHEALAGHIAGMGLGLVRGGFLPVEYVFGHFFLQLQKLHQLPEYILRGHRIHLLLLLVQGPVLGNLCR